VVASVTSRAAAFWTDCKRHISLSDTPYSSVAVDSFVAAELLQQGALKMREWKMQEWKIQER